VRCEVTTTIDMPRRLAKAEATILLLNRRIGELQSMRDRLRNELAGGTSDEAAKLRAENESLRADLARAEQRRKDAKAEADEYGAALDEVGDYLLKLGVPVPIEGYRGAPTRLLGDIMTAVSQPAAVKAADEDGES